MIVRKWGRENDQRSIAKEEECRKLTAFESTNREKS